MSKKEKNLKVLRKSVGSHGPGITKILATALLGVYNLSSAVLIVPYFVGFFHSEVPL